MPDLRLSAACVVKQGVTCSCCHPGLKMTGRMGPSHFAIWVSVPSFSEDRRNRNSRYEIKGVISQSFILAPSPLCFLSTSGESFIHLLLSRGSARKEACRALERKGSLKEPYKPLHLCPSSQTRATSVPSIGKHWPISPQHQLQASSFKECPHPCLPSSVHFPQGGSQQGYDTSPPPSSHLLGSFQILVQSPSYFWGELTGLS